jgi:leader peptidase (prepilin peptidase)/N-methyltransferase
MTGIFLIVGALFGLTLGSFLNVVVYRTPRHLSVVRPGSFCPTCSAELTAVDNVPVLAWLWLRGRCRHCGKPISPRYPLVEAGTAAVFVGLASTIRPLFGIPGWWALAATFGVVALIASDHQVCPPAVTVIGGATGIGALVVGSLVARRLDPIPQAGIGFGVALVLAGVVAASPRLRAKFGAASITLILGWGACLGWLGIAPALIAAGVAGSGLLATTLLASRRRSPGRGSAGSQDLFAACLVIGLAAGVVAAGLGA